MHIVTSPIDLVGRFQDLVELPFCQLNEPRVGDPRAVMPIVGFAAFVRTDLFQCLLIRLRVILDGNLRCHAANRTCTATVAGLDRQQGIRSHEVS